VQLALVDGEPPSGAALAQAFGGHNVVGGTAAGGQAKVWTDFYPDADNCVRVVVHGGAMSSNASGISRPLSGLNRPRGCKIDNFSLLIWMGETEPAESLEVKAPLAGRPVRSVSDVKLDRSARAGPP
jgi:hypothetical protein